MEAERIDEWGGRYPQDGDDILIPLWCLLDLVDYTASRFIRTSLTIRTLPTLTDSRSVLRSDRETTLSARPTSRRRRLLLRSRSVRRVGSGGVEG